MTPAPGPSPYEQARHRGDEELRSALLDAASTVLEQEGSGALTMRRLAEEAGCSTTVWYRLFGGKQQVVRGLYREGFDRLRHRLEDVGAAGPAEHLGALARAYREFALAEPAYYRVMFSRPVPEFTPSPDDVDHARGTLQVLVRGVAAVHEAVQVSSEDPILAAERLWAAAHGAVSLELAGHLDGQRGEEVFTRLTAAAARDLIERR